MGCLLVVGIGALGYGLYTRSQTASLSGAPPSQAQGDSVAPDLPAFQGGGQGSGQNFGMLFLDEPEGTTIRSMQVSGDTLVLELAGGPQARPNRVTVIDLKSGSILGRINLGSAL